MVIRFQEKANGLFGRILRTRGLVTIRSTLVCQMEMTMDVVVMGYTLIPLKNLSVHIPNCINILSTKKSLIRMEIFQTREKKCIRGQKR